MNQHLLVKMHQLGMPHRCVVNLGNTMAITCNWRLDLDGPAFSLRS